MDASGVNFGAKTGVGRIACVMKTLVVFRGQGEDDVRVCRYLCACWRPGFAVSYVRGTVRGMSSLVLLYEF